MDKIFKLILVAVSIVLGYLCVQSILIPIKFNEEKFFREKVVIARLADIRRAQVEYRTAKGVYTNSFDTLIAFVRQGKAPIILKEGSLTDKQLEAGLTEKEAVRQGIIKRDTTYVSILESLFGKNYPIDSIRYVPFSNPLTEFEMEKGELDNLRGLYKDRCLSLGEFLIFTAISEIKFLRRYFYDILRRKIA